MTGFFINTNKTADINKDEADKGYNMPWQYEEMQYWLAKLRDWQKKYNPISKPTAWAELTANQLGDPKDIRILKAMGTATFLFRDATNNKNSLPLGRNAIEPLWYTLLDKRFDLPTIGPRTIAELARVKGAVLAIEAGKTIVIDATEVVQSAEKAHIAVVARP